VARGANGREAGILRGAKKEARSVCGLQEKF